MTGYGTGPGLGGWNCRHSMFPFYEDFSTKTYTDDELKELKELKQNIVLTNEKKQTLAKEEMSDLQTIEKKSKTNKSGKYKAEKIQKKK